MTKIQKIDELAVPNKSVQGGSLVKQPITIATTTTTITTITKTKTTTTTKTIKFFLKTAFAIHARGQKPLNIHVHFFF